jgi:iron complex outermembrane recepter protein
MRRALALAAAIAMHWAAAATAVASGARAEVVTTADERPEPVRAAALVSVRDQLELDDRGIETIDDLQFQVPSLVAGGFLDLALRGVGAAVGPGGDPPFAVYQDGVLASRVASLNVLHDLERVEILRGPQGPSYGRGASGGAMSLVTRQPTDSFEAGLNYELGSRSDSRVRGVLNAPLVGGRGAARLAVLYASERSDFSLLSTPGRESIGEDTVSVRGSLRYQLLEDVRADLGWTFLRQDGGAIHPTGVANDAATAPRGEASSRTPAQRAHFATLGLSWRLGDFTVESISGYQSADSSLDVGGLSAVDDIRSWSSEVALLFDDGGPFHVLMGFRYFDERNQATRDDDARGPHAATDSRSPRHAAELERWSLQARADNRSSEGFTDATYELTPSWRIGAGFRLAYTDRKFVDRSASRADGAVASPRENRSGTTRRADWSAVSWRVVADFDVGERSLLYGAISTADRPGGFDFLREDPFRAEDLLAFEIGAKSVLFGERLRVSAATFFYDYRDVQARVAMAENELVVVNLAAAESFGAELDWTAEPIDALLFNGTAGWLRSARRGRSGSPSAPRGIAAPR